MQRPPEESGGRFSILSRHATFIVKVLPKPLIQA